MRALILNCSLKLSPFTSNTEALAGVLCKELEQRDVEVTTLRVVNHNVLPGVSSDEGSGDEWPSIRSQILTSDILILASPTWVGRLSSVAQRVIERMDAMLSEKDEQGRPVAFNRVAGFVATGNEDGAKHTIGEMAQALIEIGFTVPGQSWTYWNNGAAIGDSYTESDDKQGKERAATNAQLAAHVLVGTAKALNENPLGSPPS